MQINIGDHKSEIAGYLPVPVQHRAALYWARARARVIAQTLPAANKYFMHLPFRRSLTELLDMKSIWVNYSVSLRAIDYGETTLFFEIALAPGPFRIGRWQVLGTLIHELAHSDGAAWGPNDTEAEESLIACGLGRKSEKWLGDDPYTPYAPWVRG